jgi:succinate dehydrogenase/fumarate reductase flavoprotein subunit
MPRATETAVPETTDIVVIGSGGAGMVAALTAAERGAEVTLLEKALKLGGTTSQSGAGIWIPNSRPVVEAVGETTEDELRTYLRRVVGDRVDQEKLDTFLETGPDVVEFIEDASPVEFQFADYPDYYPEWPGGDVHGRMIEPSPYDSTRLGDRVEDVRDNRHTPIPITIGEMMEGGQANFPTDEDRGRIESRREQGIMVKGEGLTTALYEALLTRSVTVCTDAPATGLVQANGVVTGVEVTTNGKTATVETGAVIIAAGGFEWNDEMVENFLPGPMDAPMSPPHNEGDGIRFAMELGAKLGNMNEAWWCPAVSPPGQSWEEGSQLSRLVILERTVPGSIIVNEEGERFGNESGNYNAYGKRFQEFDATDHDYRNDPAYLVFDSSVRQQYTIFGTQPHHDDPEWFTTADSPAGLAADLSVDEAGLEATLQQFNEAARDGEDPRFDRGKSAYDQHTGDPDTDHPNLGPLDDPPFYGIEIDLGALGTKGGVVTDTGAAVLDVNEAQIPGLYASSNSAAHIMGIGYAGGGATLGPNIVYGYIAAESAVDFVGQ